MEPGTKLQNYPIVDSKKRVPKNPLPVLRTSAGVCRLGSWFKAEVTIEKTPSVRVRSSNPILPHTPLTTNLRGLKVKALMEQFAG